MRAIERFVRGKRADPGACEDAIVVTADFAAVIDGATDKTDREFRGRCGGRFAADTLAEGFAELPADVDLHGCVTALTARLRHALEETTTRIDINADDGPSAVFVAYSAHRGEVWRVGDASWRIGSQVFHGEKKIDLVTAATRVALLRALVDDGERIEDLARNDPGRQMILPLLRHQYRFRNGTDEPYAYGSIDGRDVPERFLECWSVPPGKELVLASDGYPVVCESLAQAETYLARDLAHDPLRIVRHWETKGLLPGNESFDDRAYLRVVT